MNTTNLLSRLTRHPVPWDHSHIHTHTHTRGLVQVLQRLHGERRADVHLLRRPGVPHGPRRPDLRHCWGADIALNPTLSPKKAHVAPGAKLRMVVRVRNMATATNYPGIGLAITLPEGVTLIKAAPSRVRVPPATATSFQSGSWTKGDKTFQTLNTSVVPESGAKQYFTDARAQAALATQLSSTSSAASAKTAFRHCCDRRWKERA